MNHNQSERHFTPEDSSTYRSAESIRAEIAANLVDGNNADADLSADTATAAPLTPRQPLMVAKSALCWAYEASNRPAPDDLWDGMWHQGELCCLFADSNLGKSILAMQIAASVARKRKVAYFDFEMSDKQFQMRYTREDGRIYQFPDSLFRVELDAEALAEAMAGTSGAGMSLEDMIIEAIESTAKELKARAVIVDNITYLE